MIEKNAIQRRLVLDLKDLYSNRSTNCYNKSRMVRKLRTREILFETDFENEDESKVPLQVVTISHSAIRQRLQVAKSQCKIAKQKAINFRKRFINRTIKSIIEDRQFECPICLELLVCPVMMQCGHAFCFRCLQSNAAYSQRCCLCRKDQEGLPHLSLPLAERLIERFLLPSQPEFLRYLCRTTESAEWAKRRRLINFKQGLVVDFQDKCNVWRRGVIVNTTEPGHVEVKINIKGVDLFEKVKIGTRRLAPFTFFTRSRYLQDFPTCLPEHDRAQIELNKLEFRQNWMEENTFNFPQSQSEEEEFPQNIEEYANEDEALRIFHSEMRDIDLMLNL